MLYKKSTRGFTIGSLLFTFSISTILAQYTTNTSSTQTSRTINIVNSTQTQYPTTEIQKVDTYIPPTTQTYTPPATQINTTTYPESYTAPTNTNIIPTTGSVIVPIPEPVIEKPAVITPPTYSTESATEIYKNTILEPLPIESTSKIDIEPINIAPLTTQLLPPEVQKLKDITSTIETVKTTVDGSKEIIRKIVDQRIQDALNKTRSVPDDAKAMELKKLRDKIINNIGTTASSTTTNTPINTKELKDRIHEDLNKIDKIIAEIHAIASSTPESGLIRDLNPETKYIKPVPKYPETSTSSTTYPNKIDDSEARRKLDDYNATNTEYRRTPISDTLEARLEELKNDIIPPTPAESAKRINNLIDVIAETVDDQSQAFKENGGDLLFKDSNNDGVSDYESIHLYNMDPIAPPAISVYEGREIKPEEKILLGFDPSKTELVKIEHQNPRESTFITSAYTVEDVKLTEEKVVEIKGKALPNSFVTLYIYSTPIIVTVKADENGEWSYTLDKELENGQHTIYTASVNNSGKILARSPAITFVKTAEAATIEPSFVEISGNTKPGIINSRDLFFIITGFIGIILIAINIIGSRTNTILKN